MSLFNELRRRNVIRMAGLYLVGAWLVTQVAATLLPVFGAPAWVMKTVVGVLAIGFLAALVLAWIFELTPAGLKRDEEVPPGDSIAPQIARRMNRMIIAVLHARLRHGNRRPSKFGQWPLVDAVEAANAGNRAEANRYAVALDARPAGPFLLALYVVGCHCGVPFDLSATPNFKARLAESGLRWPPPAAIALPLRAPQRP